MYNVRLIMYIKYSSGGIVIFSDTKTFNCSGLYREA